MILWRNTENYPCLSFHSDPRFSHFYYMLGGNLGSLLNEDVTVMNNNLGLILPGVGLCLLKAWMTLVETGNKLNTNSFATFTT